METVQKSKTIVPVDEHDIINRANRLVTAIKSSGVRFTRIIWIGKGAYNIMRLVAKGLDFPREHIFELGITRYDAADTASKRRPMYYRVPNGVNIVGQDCLVIDDRLDEGNTMNLAVILLLEELGAASVQPATLYLTDDLEQDEFPELRARTIAVERLSASIWIEFPWERKNESNRTVEDRLISMGYLEPWPAAAAA